MANILVVDDSESALQTVEGILTEVGHRVLPFTCGRDAVKAIRKEPVDLVITDIYMPEEDGLEVLRDARRIRPDLPVIVMSAVTGKRSMLRMALHLGAVCALVKPFSRKELIDTVLGVLKV